MVSKDSTRRLIAYLKLQATRPRFYVAVLTVGGIVWFTCQKSDREKEAIAFTMIGKSKAEVLAVLGEPRTRGHYEYPVLDYGWHPQREIDKWKASTTAFGFTYGDVIIDFNVNEVVINVRRDKFAR